jgi:hypothetical protein
MSPTTTLDSEIRARIDAFAAELGTLVRRSAVDAVRGALGDGTVAPRRRGPGRPRKAAAPARRGPGRPPKASKAKPGRRGRRSPEAVTETAELLQAHVRANPGQRMEEISAALKVPTSALTLPVSKLVARGGLRTEGQKRGTRYYSGGGRAVAAKSPGRKAGRRKAGKTSKKA